MDLRQIRYFLRAADTLNFSRAAELSNVSQPALSKAVQKLEDELGGRLIYRDGKDTRLTELGRIVRTEFEKIVASAERAKELAHDVLDGGGSVLSVGLATTLGPEPVSSFLNSVMAEMGPVELIVESIDQRGAEELVLSGGLDACFCIDAVNVNPKLQAIPLYTEHLYVATEIEHRFAKISEIPIHSLAEEVYIDRLNCDFRRRVIDHFTDHNVLMNPRVRSDREDWVQHAVATGVGVAMVPEHTVTHEGVRLTPIEGLNLSRQVDLVTIFGSGTSSAVQQLRDRAGSYAWPQSTH